MGAVSTKPNALTVEKLRKMRHPLMHQADGVYVNFRGRLEFSPYSKQPPCEVCGEPRGTPIKKEQRDEST